MIELELKYAMHSGLEKRLREKYRETAITQQDDHYYDTVKGTLYERGNFLRIRSRERIDFKLYAGDDTHLFCEETNFDLEQFTDENENLCRLVSSLGLRANRFRDFDEFRANNSLVVIAEIKKCRYEYTLEHHIVSLDYVQDLGVFVEIEARFDDEKIDAAKAADALERNLVDLGIIDLSVDRRVSIGYVELYLKRFNTALYEIGKYKE